MTPQQVSEETGVKLDTLRKRWKELYSDRPYSMYAELTNAEYSALVGERTRGRKPSTIPAEKRIPEKRTEKTLEKETEATTYIFPGRNLSHIAGTEKEKEKEAMPEKRNKTRRGILIALIIVPTAASVNNMFSVAAELGESDLTAGLFTVLLSLSALGFTLAGVRSALTKALAVFLIAFEAFCNLARIYDHLMPCGVPARFTGMVTNIFETGSHGTAVALALVTSLIIASVQYTAINELNKA